MCHIYISLVQYYIANDNYPEFKERLGRFTKGCLAKGNHTDLRNPLSCERLAAGWYPGQVGFFAFFSRNSLWLWPESHCCPGGPLPDVVRPFPGKLSFPRANVSSWVSCSSWSGYACSPCTWLPSVGAGPRAIRSLCNLDLPASCQEQCKSWCAARNAAGSANFRSRALSFPSNSKDWRLNLSLSMRWCVSLTDKDTVCKNLPCWSQQEFTPSLERGTFLAIPYLSIVKEQRGAVPHSSLQAANPPVGSSEFMNFHGIH